MLPLHYNLSRLQSSLIPLCCSRLTYLSWSTIFNKFHNRDAWFMTMLWLIVLYVSCHHFQSRILCYMACYEIVVLRASWKSLEEPVLIYKFQYRMITCHYTESVSTNDSLGGVIWIAGLMNGYSLWDSRALLDKWEVGLLVCEKLLVTINFLAVVPGMLVAWFLPMWR